jgi:O-antigen/teichoic acid export membrane protein
MNAEHEPVPESANSLTRNAIWSFIGLVVPLPLALITVPVLTNAIGTDRFGILALMLAVVGYSSFLDLGVGKALTRIVAKEVDSRTISLESLIWSAILGLGLLGMVGAIVVALFSPWVVGNVMRIPENLQAEASSALRLMALSVPLVTVTSGLRGVLEAHHRFREVSMLNSLVGIALLVAPVIAITFSISLIAIAASILGVRVLGSTGYLLLARHYAQLPLRGTAMSFAYLRPLLRIGGWMTVSNVIGPFLTYFDRFVVGALASASAVAYYTVPYDVVTRVSVFPTALSTVMFPAISRVHGVEPREAVRIVSWGLNKAFLLVFPVAVLVMFLAPDFLLFWMGPEFQRESSPVMQWLAAGLLVNALAQTPFVFLQGAGRPDLTAKLHALELVPYVGLLVMLVTRFGVTGAAAAWTIRASADAFLLLWMSQRLLGEPSDVLQRGLVFSAATALLLALSQVPFSLVQRAIALAIVAACFAPLAWLQLLSTPEREGIIARLRRIKLAPKATT